MPEPPQVDFYQLGDASLDARELACRLALMAWERGHRILILTESDAAAAELDELMWTSPGGRFLPHGRAGAETGTRAPVQIGGGPGLQDADVVINLCARPVTATDQFRRLLEIVPHQQSDRIASREKYRYYKEQGLTPAYHEISR
jgi:DNA polymerase-3 subunit chi